MWSPSRERKNSTANALLLVVGSLLGHSLLSGGLRTWGQELCSSDADAHCSPKRQALFPFLYTRGS